MIPERMHREHHRWHSPALDRDMDLLWYGTWGRPVLTFPTSMGGPSQNEDCGLIPGIAHTIDGGQIQVCSVDSLDGEIWYNQGAHPGWKIWRYDEWDRYLRDEVIPLVRHKARRDDVIVYGASWGAFHAMNFGLRHPELVSRIICFSGVFDLHRMLDGYWNELCYFHCPTAYVANYGQDQIDRSRHLGIVVATGEHDHLVEETRSFGALLQSKGLDAHVEIWPGVFGHDWPFWVQHLPRFVP